jgi:S-adenosylmethionine:tRNA ribosyltransferase-isomerase
VRVSDFHFDLPEDLIAQHPPAVRGSSRMLVLNRAPDPAQPSLTDELFSNLPSILQPGDLLILNDSRVLPARLFATRAGLTTQHNSPQPTGQIEVLLTEQVESQPGENIWHALVKPARKVQPGETLHFHDGTGKGAVITGREAATGKEAVILSGARSAQSKDPDELHAAPSADTVPTTDLVQPALTAEILATGEFGERTLRFAPIPDGQPDFYATLTRIGHMPLPPYIHRNQATAPDSPEDLTRYQTVYSHQPGSAAAPTAGLHFTPEILAALTTRGIQIATITLHVGLGTFQPVRVSTLEEIRLHSERYTLPAPTAEALNRALAEGRRIIAVGTTTTRTLEHIAQIATKLGAPSQTALPSEVGSSQAPSPLHIEPHSGQTSIFLSPGHRFRIVSGLLTNFHLPESTLLMLAAAFAGAHSPEDPNHGRQTILAAYAHAIRHHYRFYSYGDCMLLL